MPGPPESKHPPARTRGRTILLTAGRGCPRAGLILQGLEQELGGRGHREAGRVQKPWLEGTPRHPAQPPATWCSPRKPALPLAARSAHTRAKFLTGMGCGLQGAPAAWGVPGAAQCPLWVSAALCGQSQQPGGGREGNPASPPSPSTLERLPLVQVVAACLFPAEVPGCPCGSEQRESGLPWKNSLHPPPPNTWPAPAMQYPLGELIRSRSAFEVLPIWAHPFSNLLSCTL